MLYSIDGYFHTRFLRLHLKHMMWFLLSVFTCYLTNVSGQFYLTDTFGDWSPKTDSCQLARPSISFSKDGKNTVNLDDSIVQNIVGSEVWIGYVTTFEVFQYIGCVHVTDIDDHSVPYMKVGTVRSPGQCYSACKNYTLFGIRKTSEHDCFCIKEDIGNIKDTRDDCDRPCTKDQFVCGNADYLSLYTKASINTEKTNDDNCLSYKPRSGEYSWEECNCDKKCPNIYALCYTDINDTWPTKSKHKMSWSDAMDDCFSQDKYQLSKENMKPGNLQNKQYWTGYINTDTIANVGDLPAPMPAKYGYLEVKNNKVHLKFTNKIDKCSRALCYRDPMTTSSTTTAKTLASSTTKASMKTTTTVSSSTDGGTSPSSSDQSITTTSSADDDANTMSVVPRTEAQVSDENKTGIYVGVPLAILVCVGIAVILAMCYKKRHGLKDKHPTSSPISNLTYNNFDDDDGRYVDISIDESGIRTSKLQENGKLNTGSDNKLRTNKESNKLRSAEAGPYDYAVDVDGNIPDNTSTSPAYFVLEKLDKCPDGVTQDSIEPQIDNASEYTYISDTNFYNTTNFNTDEDSYDHIGKTKVIRMEDGHYDTTVKGGPHYDTTVKGGPHYDTTTKSMTLQDTYDHVSTHGARNNDDGHYDTTVKGESH